jgi:hypothetical protein
MHEDASRTRQKRGVFVLFTRQIREQITEKRGTTQAPSLCSAKLASLIHSYNTFFSAYAALR